MTIEEMVSSLGILLDREAPEESFTPEERVHYLNTGQRYVANELPIEFIRQLETVSTAQAVSATGGVSLAGLSPRVLNGDRGIVAVLHSGGKYCTPLHPDERREADSYDVTFSDQSPRFFIEGTSLYVRPYTHGSTTATLTYKRVPTDMAMESSGRSFVVTAQDPLNSSQFFGPADAGLSTENDAYNGQIIYHRQWGTYHVVADYVGATRLFVVSAEVASSPRQWETGQSFQFITKQSGFAGVDCELDEDIQDLIVEYAGYLGLRNARQYNAASGLFDIVRRRINQYVNRMTGRPQRVIMEVGYMTNRYGTRLF